MKFRIRLYGKKWLVQHKYKYWPFWIDTFGVPEAQYPTGKLFDTKNLALFALRDKLIAEQIEKEKAASENQEFASKSHVVIAAKQLEGDNRA